MTDETIAILQILGSILFSAIAWFWIGYWGSHFARRFHLRWRQLHIPAQVRVDSIKHTVRGGQILIGDPPKDISESVVLEDGHAWINTTVDYNWRRRFKTCVVARQPIKCHGAILESTSDSGWIHIRVTGDSLETQVETFIHGQMHNV